MPGGINFQRRQLENENLFDRACLHDVKINININIKKRSERWKQE
jgi:hypothetical protein